MHQLALHLEAMIFAAQQPVEEAKLQDALKQAFGWEISFEELQQAIEEIKDRYEGDQFAFELKAISGGWQFLTKKPFHAAIQAMLQIENRKKLSQAALETLAVIAYKQPVSKTDIEQIRGVNCDYTLQKLLEKDLIVISGRADGPGRPLLYATGQLFADYFGIHSPKDLPKLKDLIPDEQAEEN